MKLTFSIILMMLITNISSFSQLIKIDGDEVSGNIKLPTWLNEGQSLEAYTNVSSISVIEFNVVETQLQFSGVINVTNSSVTVPAEKVWKLVSIHFDQAAESSQTSAFEVSCSQFLRSGSVCSTGLSNFSGDCVVPECPPGFQQTEVMTRIIDFTYDIGCMYVPWGVVLERYRVCY